MERWVRHEEFVPSQLQGDISHPTGVSRASGSRTHISVLSLFGGLLGVPAGTHRVRVRALKHTFCQETMHACGPVTDPQNVHRVTARESWPTSFRCRATTVQTFLGTIRNPEN
eukprot:1159924-Pelagomonas_calceolata.AAC.3